MKEVNLFDICNPKQWKTISSSEINENGKYPVYGANGVIGYYDVYNHQDATLIVGCRGSCGTVYITQPKSYVTGNAMSLDNLDVSNIKLKYLYYYLNNRGFSDIITGTSQPQITQTGLKEIFVPRPSISVQNKIVKILDQAEEIKRRREESIKKLAELKKSLLNETISNKFNETSLGELLTELTDYHANGSYKILKKNVELLDHNDYSLMVRTTDLENNEFENNVKYITKEAYEFLKKSKVFGGEIIINKIGSAGNVYLMPNLNRPVSLGMNQFLLRLDSNKANNVFVYYFLASEIGQKRTKNKIRGAVTKTITKEAVRSIKINLPNINKQNKFASQIEVIEDQLLLSKKSLEEIQNLSKSLLQKAFKGELTLN